MSASRILTLSLPLILVASSLVAGCSGAPSDLGDGAESEAVAASGDSLSSTWYALDTRPAGTAAEVVFDAARSTTQVSYFDVKIHGFYVEAKVSPRGVSYQKVTVPGLATLGQPGAPALPVFRTNLALGTNAANGRVVAVSRTGTKTFAAMNVWPQGQDETDEVVGGTPERFVQDSTTYALRSNFPTTDGYASKASSKLDGIGTITGEGYPIRWNPTTKVLVADAAARFAVYHDGQARSPLTISKLKAESAVKYFSNWTIAKVAFPINTIKFEGNFLFVYPAKYAEEIKPLVQQKKARGYQTTELTTESIGSTCTTIRTAINNWHAARPASTDKYAILVGDVDAIPTCTSPTGIPTDDLYASTNGDDLDEEIYLGRLSVDDEADLTNQVTKILRYENTPAPLFNYGQALLVAHKEGAPGKYVGAHESVRTATYAVAPTFMTQYGSVAGVTNATVSAQVNAGYGLVAYRGHGSSGAWTTWNQTSQSYANADVLALANPATRTPVLWSFACNNSELGVADAFGEAWMEDIDNRAVAFYGATVPSGTTANHELDRQMFKAVYDLGLTTHGKAIEYAEAQMTAIAGSENAWMYLLLGDPEMKIRRRAPFSLAITAPVLTTRCPTSVCPIAIRVLDSLGNPLSGLKISAYKPGLTGDEVNENLYSDALGNVNLPVAPRTAGPMFVSAEGADGSTQTVTVNVQ